MSTTTEHGGWRAIHDSDPRGGHVEVVAPDGRRLTIPYALLEEVVADCVRRDIIARVEQMPGAGLLAHLLRI